MISNAEATPHIEPKHKDIRDLLDWNKTTLIDGIGQVWTVSNREGGRTEAVLETYKIEWRSEQAPVKECWNLCFCSIKACFTRNNE